MAWCSIGRHRANFTFTFVYSFPTVAIFVTVDSKTIFHEKFVDMFIICLRTKFHISSSNGSSVIAIKPKNKYEGVSRSFRTGRLERELQMVQLSAVRCSCIAILWVSLASFAAITLCVASQRVYIVISLSTQSGNFWIHPPILSMQTPCCFTFSKKLL
jgi:hypothetical protein